MTLAPLPRLALSLFLLLPLIAQGLDAQSRGDHWFTGTKLHLWFDASGFNYDRNSKILAGEAKSAISTPDGACLFYTTATELWDCSGNLVTDQLRGDNSSSQGALVIPMPEEPDLYYVITADACLNDINNFTVDGISWSVVRAVPGEAVSVVTLNRPLISDIVAEKLDATLHANGRDYWLSVREPGTATFLTWLISPAGFSPVISQTIGTPDANPRWTNGEDQCMTGKHHFSPNGQHLIFSSSHSLLELFDFDNSTGRFSNPRLLVDPADPDRSRTYDAAFSPGSCFLYGGGAGDRFGTYQYDLRGNPDRETIIASRVLLSTPQASSTVESWGANTFQNAPDGRLYFNAIGEIPAGFVITLGRILYPDVKGLACGYVPQVLLINPGESVGWLPNFVDSWFSDPFACNQHPLTPFTTDTVLCAGATATFRVPWTDINELVTTWDVDGGIALETTDTSARFRFESPGVYRVVVRWENPFGLADSAVGSIRVTAPFSVEAGQDRVICRGESVTLGDRSNRDLGRDVVLLWRSEQGEELEGPEPEVTPATSTTYRVVARDTLSGCQAIDSVRIDVLPTVTIDLGEERLLCEPEEISIAALLTPGDPDIAIEWEVDGVIACDTCREITLEVTRNHRVVVRPVDDGFCGDPDTLEIILASPPPSLVTTDTSLCLGQQLRLVAETTPSDANFEVTWSPTEGLDNPAAMSPVATPAETTTYVRQVRDRTTGCLFIDTLTLSVVPPPTIALPSRVRLCPDDTLVVEPAVTGENLRYEWSGPQGMIATGDRLVVTEPVQDSATYSLRVTDTLSGCSTEASLPVVWREARIALTMRRDYHIWSGLNQVIEIEATEISADEQIRVIEGDITFDPRVLVINPSPLSEMLEGTLFEGWIVERSEIVAPGLMSIRLRAPLGEVLQGEGTLLRLVANLFIGPARGSEIGFSFRMDGRCLDLDYSPGYVRLDTLCNLEDRLLEIGAGKYRAPVATPNPSAGDTRITFGIGIDALTRLRVYDLSGQLVITLVDEELSAGEHSVLWTAPPAGVYLLRLESGGFTGEGSVVVR